MVASKSAVVSRLWASGFAVAALLAGATLRAGSSADEEARRAEVVARVGPVAITAGEVEDRIGPMPPFQRAIWGSSPESIRHRFLAEVLVPRALLALAADAEDAGSGPPAAYALERARSGATVRAIRAHVGSADAISRDDVRGYYEQNRDRFDAPARYRIWRILCKTQGEAQAVLDAVKADPTPKEFSDLARAHSLDRATYLRGGNLGFVTADGGSAEPGLRVDPAVVRAVEAVRDGEIVAAPVAEGESFAVVWRRGTVRSVHASLDDAAPAIRDILWKARIKSETDQLVARLRAEKVRDLNESWLESAEIPVYARSDGGTAAPR